jgi:hypothetical protein
MTALEDEDADWSSVALISEILRFAQDDGF